LTDMHLIEQLIAMNEQRTNQSTVYQQ